MICYLPLGDPAVPEGLAETYAEEGVDVFEIGVPAADAYLDGPLISDSMQRSLQAGTDRRRAVEMISDLRQRFPDKAMLWMTYPNAAGPNWPRAVAASGADGALLPVSARAQRARWQALESRGLAFAQFVAAPSSAQDRHDAKCASGYVMVQARPGPTGSGAPQASLGEELRELRRAGVKAPLAVGFGIDGPQRAQEVVAAGADAIIVGSAMVSAALEGLEAVRRLIRGLRETLL